jgi:hypothetical protein
MLIFIRPVNSQCLGEIKFISWYQTNPWTGSPKHIKQPVRNRALLVHCRVSVGAGKLVFRRWLWSPEA